MKGLNFRPVDLARHPFATINAHKELRYLVAGTASEAIEYVSFLILIALLPKDLYISNSISFILGVISGFSFHKTWTFRGEQQFKTHQQAVGYLSLAGINFVAINVFIGFYVHGLHMVPDLAKLAAIATTVVWTYLLSNYVIFRHRTPDPTP
jgi:putative flippase GtrA